MALADIVLEGLMLILVIALGAVLIGGLSYLTTTTVSANNARLITAGTYVYLPGPTYINSTLYIPMYNIGKYAVYVKYLFVKGVNGVQEYTTNMILKPGQYYVYELSIDYTPEAVTIVVSPINDPRLALEFSSNVSTPKPIALTPISQATFSNCPVTVIVNDPYNATWQVTWSSKSGLSGSRVGSSTDRWCVIPNSPGVINFQASVTNNPNNYACWVDPQQTWVNYTGAPVGAVFNVECAAEFVYVNVNDPYNAGWNVSSISTIYINPEIQEGSVYATITGSSSVSNQILPIPLQCTSSGCSAAAELVAHITSNPTNPPYTCSINPSYVGSVTPGGTYNFAVSCTPLFIYVNVLNDTYHAGWEVESVQSWDCNLYSCSPVPYATISGDTDVYHVLLPVTLGWWNWTSTGQWFEYDYVVAQITSNPRGYVCTIKPEEVTPGVAGWPTPDGLTDTTLYGLGGTYNFTVSCAVAPIKVKVEYTPWTSNVGWLISWSGAATGSQSGNSPTTFNVYPGENATVYFTAKITSIPSIYKSCAITPTNTTAYPSDTVTFTVNCTPKYFVYVTVTGDEFTNPITGGIVWSVSSSVYTLTYNWNVENWPMPIGGPTDTLYAQIVGGCPGHYTCSINPSSIQVTNGSHVTFQISMKWKGGSSGSGNYLVYVTVTNDTLGASWQIKSSVSSISGSGDVTNQTLKIGGQTDTLTASVTSPSGYACSISPGSTPATNGSSYTFTVNCVQSPYPPCTVSPPSVSSSPSGAPTPSSGASTSSIPYGQSEEVTFTYNAPESGNNYKFQYWSIGGQTYQNNVVNITETLTCTTPGGTLTGPSGTAYYQYQPPGTIGIDPDWIDLTQSGETYTFTWTSDWSGTGTFTWSISGLVIIYYNETPSGSVTWNGKVSLPDGTVAAQGSGYLKITNYPTPPDPFHYYECGVGGSGTVNDVSASGDSVKGTVSISCTLESIFG